VVINTHHACQKQLTSVPSKHSYMLYGMSGCFYDTTHHIHLILVALKSYIGMQTIWSPFILTNGLLIHLFSLWT